MPGMGNVTGVTDIDIGVGRYGLRTFKPAIVRDLPHLVSVSQNPIPPIDPRFRVKPEWRELLTESHPVAWEDGTCKAACIHWERPPNTYGRKEYHDPPDKQCGCGVYALDDLKDLHNQYKRNAMIVVAVISASGRTIECEKGIRTAFARVVAYWVLDHEKGCTCLLCAEKLIQHRPAFRSKLWGDEFPFMQCCAAQFKDAQRFDEPDDMAEHYGLKASPIDFGVSFPTRRVAGRGVQIPLFAPAPGTKGHFEFEIPVDLL